MPKQSAIAPNHKTTYEIWGDGLTFDSWVSKAVGGGFLWNGCKTGKGRVIRMVVEM